MFSTISWQEYLVGAGLFLIIYYGSILIIFLKKKQNLSPDISNTISERKSNCSSDQDEHVLLFSLVHDLIEELKETFDRALKRKFQKESLLMAVKENLVKYKKLKGTALQISINNHIIRKSEQISIKVEENDLKNIW